MGWIVGGGTALTYVLLSFILPQPIVIIMSILASILLTGGLHEDGLADVCDGFGGGWNKEKILSIMKDSSTGVYGVIGIVMVMLLKFSALSELDASQIPALLIAGHSLSRFTAVTFMYTHQYARAQEQSKSKNIAVKMSFSSLIAAAMFGIFPLFLLKNHVYFLVLIPLSLVKWLLGRYFNKWIDGYTGDCLGAAQQIAEVVFYLFILIAPWKYI